MDIMKEIDRRIVFWDGGMGSLLQERGLQPGELPETWNILHPDIVTEIHREYIEAGADIIDTNTFGANRLKFPDDGEFPVPELVRAAVKNVREAEKLAGRKVFAALDIGPTGKLLKPLGDLGFEEAYDLFAQVVRAGEEAGADLVEIGIPFSDPTAEGVVIQEANIRALKAGMTTDGVFDIVRRVR